MPKRNNPYSRPISATKESAQTIGEYYGTPAKAVAVNHAAGGRNVSPAARYQVAGNAYVPPPTTPSRDATSPTDIKSKAKKIKSVSTVDTPITAEDLFGP